MAESQKKGDTKAQEPKKNKKRTTWVIAIIIGFLAMLVIAQFVKIFLDRQEKIELEEQYKEEQRELATAMQELSDIRTELDEKIVTIEELGGNIDSLVLAKKEVEQLLSNTRTANRRTINSLRGKVDGFQELLEQKDKEIVRLKAINEQLFSENTDLKTEKNELSRAITELNKSKSELEGKIEIASELRAEGVRITAVSSRGRERESPFRARQVNQLKVVFNIAENEVAPIEAKDIMIRIMDPQNNVIFDVTKGSGTFMLDGREEFFTAKQEILFDNSQQELTFLYNKGTDYEAGSYRVEIYTDEYLMGSGEFVIR